ncbi:MAG: dTMP kinase [bacterium]|nr:MAG: dTMP kinase [bacterium]
MKRGKFVVFEGGMGCGKTTQINLLKKILKKNWDFYREPGGTPYGEKVRDAVQGLNGYSVEEYAAMFGYTAARANLIRGLIIPQLEKGKNIILDRYWYSTYAYQSIENVAKKDILEISKISTKDLRPDIIVHFDLDPKDATQRKSGKDDADRYDLKEIGFHKKVRRNYKELAKIVGTKWHTIDASGTIEDIHNDTIKLLRKNKII